MKLSFKNADLAALLSTGLKMVENTKSVGIIADKKAGAALRLIDDNGCYFHSFFPAKVEKSGNFSIGLDILQSLTKAKTLEMEYTVEDSKLHVKSLNSRLSGKDVPLLTDQVTLAEKEKEGINFGKYQSKALLMMSEAALPSFFNKALPQFIVATKGQLVVATADLMYSAIATFAVDKLTIPEFSIPSQYAKLMREVVGDSCSITLKKNKLVISTDIIHAELPMIQTDAIATLKNILTLQEGKAKASFEVDAPVLRAELDNMLVTYEDKSPLQLKLKSNLALLYRTNRGTFNSTVKVENLKNTGDFFLDVEMFRLILSKCSGKIKVELKNSVLSINTTPIKGLNINYILSLVEQKKE